MTPRISIEVVGWRNRATGVIHLRTECRAWETVRAADVQRVEVTFAAGERHCGWCFGATSS